MEQRLTELGSLKVGWSNGEGVPPTKSLLDQASQILKDLIRECRVDSPYLYPIPEGGISAEWTLAGGRADIDFFSDGRITAGALIHGDDEHDLELHGIDELTSTALIAWMGREMTTSKTRPMDSRNGAINGPVQW